MNTDTTAFTLIEFLAKGGVMMVPLGICSLVAMAVVIERSIWGPKRSRAIPVDLQRDILSLIQSKRFEEILGLCRSGNSPLARIVLAAVRNANKTRREIVDAVEGVGRREALNLQRFIGVIGTIASVAPLLGLLGTVLGMISTFAVIEQHGIGNAPALAGGISEALISTAAGLTLAIPCLIFHRFFSHRAKKLSLELEQIAGEIVDRILESKTEFESESEPRVGKETEPQQLPRNRSLA